MSTQHHRPLLLSCRPALPFALAAVLLFACSDDNSGPDADSGTTTEDTTQDTGEGTDGGDDTESGPDTDADPGTEDADSDDGDAEDSGEEPVVRVLDPWPTRAEPPACGTPATWSGMLPGPGTEGFDAAMDAKAYQLERQFHVFNTLGLGVSRELSVFLEQEEERALIESFIRDTDSWDFEAFSGREPAEVISRFHKVAGAYGGVGAAADAFRYATLQAEGADCEELERARAFLVDDLDAMHRAFAITGVRGVVARGFIRLDQPGSDYPVVPLFDEEGRALPLEKNNGTWREDNSGLYPDFIWEDSCSRDMLIGWAIGMAAVWEVIADDPNFDEALKERLRDDAAALAETLMTVQDSGYDMEIRDADGRMTFHGILHHASIDRLYWPGAKNGFNAIMGLGIMAGLAFITQDPAIEAFIYEDLIDSRDYLDQIANSMVGLDLGAGSNFSMYNMAFQGGWLAERYLRDPVARAAVHHGVDVAMYDRGGGRQPREQKQTFFDFTYAAGMIGASAFGPSRGALDALGEQAMANGLETLGEWREMPYWDFSEVNCDEDEIDAGVCEAIDGSTITLLGHVGRNGALVAEEPLPMRIRWASNYWWRSNPYQPDGGGNGSGLYPGSDFRFVYWMGRWFQAPSGE